MKFLDQLASTILQKEISPQHLFVILPSERAKKYLSNALFKLHNGPLISPQIYTIDQWVVRLCDKRIAHPTQVLLMLYGVYQELVQEQALTFDDYLSWGPIMLSDFDDIDRYLIDEQQLYQNLASIKALESWQIEEAEYSDSQKKFMLFWEMIPKLHRGLQQVLSEANTCTKAQAYRQLALQPTPFFDSNQYFIFAGFNALSLAEQKFIKHLIDKKQAEFIIDSDAYYYDNKYHEAGHFQRKNNSFFGLPKPTNLIQNLASKAYDVKVIECAQHIGQVKVLATELSELATSNWDEILVLLADESLVHAAIRNIPKKVGQANITLGLPLDQTPMRTWIDLCFQFQENQQKFKTQACYYKDLQRFCHHAFVSLAFDQQTQKELAKVEKQTIQFNRVFQNTQKLPLPENILTLLALLTQPWQENWAQGLACLRQMNSFLLQCIPEANDFERTAILSFETACRQFEQFFDASFPQMKLGSFKKLFYQHWTRTHLAYLGSPTQGLQITGLLETRLLDFDQVFVLGMNEGKLPPNNPIQSIIPMDLRSAFGMPNNRDKQGLFAQHFYRLLHHAKQLTFTYTSASEVLGSQEKSRYLLQLEMEWRANNPKVKWQEYFYQIPSATQQQVLTSVPKTKAIQERILNYLQKGVSASALRKFANCPLDFYYRYVVEFGEEEEVEEDLQASTFGSLIHACLEELYTPFAQKDKYGNQKNPAPGPVTKQDIAKMITSFPAILRQKFLDYFDQNAALFEQGKNMLSFEMALDLTKQNLLNDLEFISQLNEPLYIEQLEAQLELTQMVEIGESQIPVHLLGYIDRIDRIGNNHYRVIDYKSGKVKPEAVKMYAKNDAYTNLTKPKHSLQLCLYTMLFQGKYGMLPSAAKIVSLINSQEDFILSYDKKTDLSIVPELFNEGIQSLVSMLLDPSIPFEHDPKAEYCQFCT